MQEKPPRLIQAFENTFDLLGERTKDVFVEDLIRQGVFLNDLDLTMSKLFYGIRHVIGDKAAEIIVEQLIIKLDELHSK